MVTLGNGLSEGRTYGSDRQQLTGITVGAVLSLKYAYCSGGLATCTNNNGNVMQQTIQGGRTQSFTYDAVNRPKTAAQGSSWSQEYGYDGFGNRWVSSNSGVALSPFTAGGASNFTGNRLQIQNSTFDAAGNMTSIGGYVFRYDGENRQTGVTLNAATSYQYDGDGRRGRRRAG